MFSFEINYWFRALARFCDYSIFFLTLGLITLFLPYFYGPSFYYILAALVPLLWAPVEAFFISRFATTLGKALFGLSIRTSNGFKISYSAALKWSFFLPGRVGFVRQRSVSWKRKMYAFLTSSAFMIAAIYGNVLALWSVGLEKGISPDGWVQYASTDAGFKISFPTDPEAASKELVIPDSGKVLNYQEITSEEGNKIHYSVSHLDLPRKWRLAGDTTLLKGVLDRMIKHLEGAELIEKEFSVHAGHRVLDFRMKQGKEETKGRLLIVGGTLYKLTMTYPPSQVEEMQKSPFLGSFELS